MSLAAHDAFMDGVRAQAASFRSALIAHYQERSSHDPRRVERANAYFEAELDSATSRGVSRAEEFAWLSGRMREALPSLRAREQIVIAPLGVFRTCLEARNFRDTALPGIQGAQFRRIDAGVQERVDEILSRFGRHRSAAEAAMRNATNQQLAAVAESMMKFFALELLGRGAAHIANNRYAFRMDRQTALAHELLAGRAIALSEQVLRAGFTQQVNLADLALINVDALTVLYGAAAPFVLTAKFGLAVTSPWMEWEPARLAASGELMAFEAAMTRMLRGSPAEMLQDADATRRIIDAQCP